MSGSPSVIEIDGLGYAYGRAEAVHDLTLHVRPGRCYGLFGRNGAGKTTTMRCVLNLLKPQRGSIRVFGMDPVTQEVDVKRRIAFVPDAVAFYPWTSVRETLDYLASFRSRWNREAERDLLGRFRLDPSQKTGALSKGQRTLVALVGAICPDPELLLLDEPTSGLDPIVRREFIQTVIGAYQDADPSNRTVLVSTHLISEFEGLIDEFTIMDAGRGVLTLDADHARERYQRIRARFAQAAHCDRALWPSVRRRPNATGSSATLCSLRWPPPPCRSSRTPTSPQPAVSTGRTPCANSSLRFNTCRLPRSRQPATSLPP